MSRRLPIILAAATFAAAMVAQSQPAPVVVTTLAPAAASRGGQTGGEGERRNNFVAFSRFNPDRDSFALFRSRLDGSDRRRMTAGPGFFPDWSPDRTLMVFDFPDEEGNEQIGVVRADGSRFRQLTDLPGISEVARFSPDGKRLVFDRSPVLPDDPDFFTSLWVMEADGANPHPLFEPDPHKFDVEPEFSPSGQRVLFARLRITAGGAQKAAIFTVRADGSRERRITRFMLGLEHPRWSPDGRRIIFNRDARKPNSGIWQVRANGHNLRQVLPASRLFGFKPVFSPNGQRILFGCYIAAQEQDDLCVMRADGSRVRNITHTPNIWENFPAWR